MSLDDTLNEMFDGEKPKMIKNALERLKKPREVETSVAKKHCKVDALKESHGTHEETDSQTSEMELDFSYLTNNSSFQRAITEFFKKFAVGFEKIKVRGTKKEIQDSFSQNKRALLLELKEVLKKRGVKGT